MEKPLVLFVCTHNAARSQMAEGLLRARHGDRFRAASAGTRATRVHPLAVEALREAGIDAAGHTSKTTDAFPDGADYVVTVCDAAREACPYVPARVRNLHHAFPDPSVVEGTDERLAAFRRTRDRIADWLDATFGDPPVEPASPDDLRAITALLDAADLPHADLTPGALVRFVVARDGEALCGVAGLEVYGASGLLRSLAVAPEARGSGLGGRLVAAVEEEARGLGLSALYLLTTTAAPFFAARGYAPTDRAGVPAPVQTSSEFTGLCPSSAACLSKSLA